MQYAQQNQAFQAEQTIEVAAKCIVDLKLLSAWLWVEPDHLAKVFSNDETSQDAICEIAETEVLSDGLFCLLAQHPSTDVRIALAENPDTPEAVHWDLVKDESVDVRFAMAESYHLSAEIMQALADDENPYVAQRASKTLQRIEAQHDDVVSIKTPSLKLIMASEWFASGSASAYA